MSAYLKDRCLITPAIHCGSCLCNLIDDVTYSRTFHHRLYQCALPHNFRPWQQRLILYSAHTADEESAADLVPERTAVKVRQTDRRKGMYI